MNLPANEKLPEKTVFETILARRSVRAYAPNEVGRKDIQTLLEAAVCAPTAMHQEPWAFVIVQDKPLFIVGVPREETAATSRKEPLIIAWQQESIV